MHLDRSNIPDGFVFSQLFFSRHRGVLLALCRTKGQVALGRLFARTLGAESYKAIALPEENLSVESVTLSQHADTGLVNILRFDGVRGDWHAIYSIDLETLEIAPLISKPDLRPPSSFDEGAIFDVLGANDDCSTIDCTVFLRNNKSGECGWYLCSVSIPEKTCSLTERLNHGRF